VNERRFWRFEVSGIHVQSNGSNVMFDTGEGSYGQLYRLFGPSQTVRQLQRLQYILISHLHADHHLGLIKILKEWQQVQGRNGHVRRLFEACNCKVLTIDAFVGTVESPILENYCTTQAVVLSARVFAV
jgi:ribonuclease BN (tRNA processing enzyme)